MREAAPSSGSKRIPFVVTALFALGCSSGNSKGPAGPDSGALKGLQSSGGASSSTPGAGGGNPSGADGAVSVGGRSTASAAAAKIGRPHFLIGMGSDLNNDHDQDGAYTLGVTMDVHYAYLTRYKGSGGWPDWNTNGTFVNILTDSAKKHGVVPMFTLYEMAGDGEGNKGALVDDDYMKLVWSDVKLMYQRLAVFDGPALVQFEPDFWAYMQQASGGNPTTLPAHVGSLAPDCAGQPETLVGMGKCLVLLGRKYAPKAILGFHASRWADGDPARVASFLVEIGAGQTDFVTTDTLDRDAGCFEAHVDPGCQRNDGPWYWDDTNKTSPNFHDHLAWVKAITDGTGKPMLWWQTPFGVPSATPGGSPGKYRDNRVKYVFDHLDEFIAAGGLGVLFGGGASNQTTYTSDGGQFKTAVTKYFASPKSFP
jgi:hypothetical protein